MKISVIIPAINEAAGVARAVRSAIDAGADETLVVDGGSRDATIELAERAGAIVLVSAAGRAVQQNAGAARATGDVLVFLHADNFLATSSLGEIRDSMYQQPGSGWGAMWQRIIDPRIRFRLIEWGNASRVHLRGLPFGDQAIFVRRGWFEQAGSFPEVPLMEDLMLSQSLRRRSPPMMIRGPVYVDARRWIASGIVRQTWRNWRLQWSHFHGADPRLLAHRYPRHDNPGPTDGRLANQNE